MSKKNAQVVQVLAGAAVLAGLGYALTRRSGARSSDSTRPTRSPRRAEPRPVPTVSDIAPKPPTWSHNDPLSSAPDVLDLALDLDGVFDGKAPITAQPSEHVPAPLSGDDQEPPAPEDLGSAWLTQATESERSLGFADTIPDVDDLPKPSADTIPDVDDPLNASNERRDTDDSTEGEDEDETIAEYVRRHRISSAG
ncbi:MAG TPA: hypothetical protein VJV79_04685 [Polyangiaceae bacterium]|nr:hypothetical protein [Polyangiaceae bacterium]